MTVSRDETEVTDGQDRALPTLVRNGAAMCLAAASGATDAIGYLALGNVFASAMTGNLALLGIALAHLDGARIGRVLVSLICYMFGAAMGARIARTPEPGDPVWPPAITRALAIEAVFFVGYAAVWWTVGTAGLYTKGLLLGLGAIALGIQSSAMQRFGNGLGLNTTFVSGALIKLIGRLATGRRFRDIQHHLLVLVGLVCGCVFGALLVLHAPKFAPAAPLVALALTFCAAGWQARARHHAGAVGERPSLVNRVASGFGRSAQRCRHWVQLAGGRTAASRDDNGLVARQSGGTAEQFIQGVPHARQTRLPRTDHRSGSRRGGDLSGTDRLSRIH